MSSLIFSAPQGVLPIPDGESRLGSDSSCQMCLRGEGVQPIHAYVRVEGERILIRPSSEKSILRIDGKLITGPTLVAHGQTVSVGPVNIQLRKEGKLVFPQWMHRTRWLLYPLIGIAALLLVAVMLRYFWFNEAWFREWLLTSIKENLLREDAEIKSVELNLLDGKLKIKRLKIPNKEGHSGDLAPLLKIEEVEVQFDAWIAIKSGFKDIRKKQIIIRRPELSLERSVVDGQATSNIDDILANLQDTLSTHLDPKVHEDGMTFKIEDGTVSVVDTHTDSQASPAKSSTIKSSIDGISITAHQGQVAQKMEAHGEANIPIDGGGEGKVVFDLSAKLLDPAGMINPQQAGEGLLNLDLTNVDVAKLFRHMQWEFPVYEGRQRIVPGKPVTGNLSVKFSDLNSYRINGNLESVSLLSVLEDDLPPVGNIPTRLEGDLGYERGKGVTDATFTLASTLKQEELRDPAAKRVLLLRLDRRRLEGGHSLSINVSADLEKLCDTDVGERLKLKGRLKGPFEGAATLTLDNQRGEGRFAIKSSHDGHVWVSPNDPFGSKPVDPRAPGMWQATHFTADLSGLVKLNEFGRLAATDLESFSIKGNSFTAEKSRDREASIKSIDKPDKVEVKAQFHLNLQGKEFWQEFGPLLRLLGYDRPIEELLDAEVTINSLREPTPAGPALRKVAVGLEGKARRQWKEPSAPVDLVALVTYFPERYAQGVKAAMSPNPKNAAPYLTLKLITTSQDSNIGTVHIEPAELAVEGPVEVLTVRFPTIKSDLAALHERFQPYIDAIAQTWTPELYKNYALSGYIEQAGASGLSIVRGTGPAGGVDADFRFSFTGRNLNLEGPLATSQPGRWNWTEPNPELTVQGNYHFQPSPNKEEPAVRRLDLEAPLVKGRLGNFKLALSQVDLEKLSHASQENPWSYAKSVADSVGRFQCSGTIETAAFTLLRQLHLLPAEPALGGELHLNAAYNGAEDSLVLSDFDFSNRNPEDFWLMKLNLVAQIHSLKQLFSALEAGEMLPMENFGQQLVVREVTLDAPAFAQWTQRFPEQARRLGIAPSLLEQLKKGDLTLEGFWVAKDVVLSPDAAYARSWTLIGKFHTDFRYILPFGAKGSARAVLSFKGPWSIDANSRAGFQITETGLSTFFRANLTQTDVSMTNLLPDWDYIKQRDQALRVVLHGVRSAGKEGQDTLYELQSLILSGGPLPIELTNVQANTKPQEEGGTELLQSLKVEKAIVSGGPVPFTLEQGVYNRSQNRIKGIATIKEADLALLTRFGLKFPGQLSGTATNLKLTVDGDIDRLKVLNPKPVEDTLEAEGHLQNALYNIQTASGDTLTLALESGLHLNLGELSFKDLRATLRHAKENHASVFRLRLPECGLKVLDPHQNLRQACAGDPPALQLTLPLKFEEAFDVDDLLSALKAAQDATGFTPAKGANPFQALSALKVDGALSAPTVTWGSWRIDKLEVSEAALKELRLSFGLNCTFLGGELNLSETNYDLSNPNVAHGQRVRYTRGDLHKILGLTRSGYALNGKFSIEGRLSGVGFGERDRLSWGGAFQVALEDLVVGPLRTPAELPGALQPLALRYGLIAPTTRPNPALFLLKSPAELASLDSRLAGGTPWLDRGLLATQIYARMLGIDAQQAAFERCNFVINLDKGVLDMPQGRLVALDPWKNLELTFRGRLRTSDMNFDPQFDLAVARLPDPARAALSLETWPADLREDFQRELADNKLRLRLSGTIFEPHAEYPREGMQRFVMRALFNRERIEDAQDYATAQQFFRGSWLKPDELPVPAAALLERAGLFLPGTASAKAAGLHFLDALARLVPSVSDFQSKDLSPEQALKDLFAPPLNPLAPPNKPLKKNP